MDADSIIAQLGMQPLPIEGGFFSVVSRSNESINSENLNLEGPRCLYGTIYYLETTNSFSQLHQLPIDEIYYFHLGDPLEMLILNKDGQGEIALLGPEILSDQRLQILAPKGCIHGSRPLPGGEHGFTLMSTSMSPGYEDGDSTFPIREDLIKTHPQFASMIRSLTTF
ncbi:MAG: cupin domain-containing protein [Pseudomonadales bacterium]|nr:cupin domain-containing protein [Pseudomonadales bacterium]